MLDGLFHKKKKVAEERYHTKHAADSLQFQKEMKRQNNFFKRKKINPHTLHHTLNYIAPCFHHREDDWEEFLRIIIAENEHRRPNYTRIQTWFHDTMQKALNDSETKYLCRYVKMNSESKDLENKLRDTMDNIDLPPVKYDSWVNEMFTLEYDDEADGSDGEEDHSSRNYFKEAFSNVITSIGTLYRRSKNGKTYPRDAHFRKQITESHLTLSSRGRPNRRDQVRQSMMKGNKKTDVDNATVESNSDLEGGESSDLIRTFS